MANILEGHGRPTHHTSGEINQHYKDLDTGKEYCCVKSYICTGVHRGETHYVWKETYDPCLMPSGIGSSGGGSGSSDMTDIDALVLLTEQGVVAPVTDKNGAIFTDEIGAIYTL